MKRFAFATIGALVGAVFFAGSAFAGPQYVDGTGFAASGYDVVALHELPQSPVGTPQPPAVPGNTAITAEYNGAKWAFASDENRAKFEADPAKYVPAYDGHCAYGIAQGGKVPGNPNLWRVVDGKLYLNITKTVVGFWEADIPGQITEADNNWQSKLDAKPATDRAVPELDQSLAPKKS